MGNNEEAWSAGCRERACADSVVQTPPETCYWREGEGGGGGGGGGGGTEHTHNLYESEISKLSMYGATAF